MENTIRQAKNVANLRGIVKTITVNYNREKGVETDVKKLPDSELTDEQIKGISINVDLQVGDEHNYLPIKLFSNRLKRNSKGEESPNGFYKGVKTVAREIVQGDKVELITNGNFVTANISMNEYYAQGELKSNMQISAKSMKRFKGTDEEFEFLNQIELEGYITDIFDEIDYSTNDTTGNKIIKLVSPEYRGQAETFEVLVETKFADAVDRTYKAGDTATFRCEFINKTIVTTREIEQAIGESYIDKDTTYERALKLVSSGLPISEEEGAYTEAIIDKAIKEKENALEEQKRRSEEKNNKQQSPKPNMAIGQSTDENDVIPF